MRVTWGRAFYLGLKYFVVSAIFTIVGGFLILSALTISVSEVDGKQIIAMDVTTTLRSAGAATLLILGLMILIGGNAAAFFKMIAEVVEESSNHMW
jgi:hypothetical protein